MSLGSPNTTPTVSELAAEFLVTEEAQLRALLAVPFALPLLGCFAAPRTPHSAAQELGLGAGQAAYHVGKFLRLGLLLQVGERGTGRLLQLRAGRYLLAPELQPLLDETALRPVLLTLLDGFLGAKAPAAEVVLLDLSPPRAEAGALPYGRLSSTRVLALSPERRQKLLRDLLARIEQEENHPDNTAAELHTVALLEFAGSPFSRTKKP